MKVLILSVALLASDALRMCESETASAPNTDTPVAEPAPKKAADESPTARGAAAASAKARMGGSLVAVGDYQVEVLLHKKGLIEAMVTDASGKKLEADSGVDLTVTAATASGPSSVKLAFDADELRFRGNAAAGAELAAEPVSIALKVRGTAAEAKLGEYALVTGPDFGGSLLVAGGYSAEVIAEPTDIRAYLHDSAGADLSAEANVQVEATLPSVSGEAQLVSLAYVPAEAAFRGEAKAGVQFAPGPLEFRVIAGGKAHVGGLASLALRAKAAHGGRVVLVGDYSVELAAQPGGLIAAYVFDANGKAVARSDLDLSLSLGAEGKQRLALAWDPPSASFRARIGGDVDLNVTPVRVSLKADGRAFAGGLLSVKAGAAANVRAKADAEGSARAKAGAAANVRAPAVKATAHTGANTSAKAGAKAAIAPPKVEVSTKKSASAGGGSAKASAGFSFGTK